MQPVRSKLLVWSKEKLFASSLLVLLYIIQISQSVKCANDGSRYPNHHHNPYDGPPRFFSNHRMLYVDEERKVNQTRILANDNHTTLIHIDQASAQSMPRPQLALQIFTSSSPSSHQNQHHHHQQQQSVNTTSNHHPARLLNTMLLMPVTSLAKNHRPSSDSDFEPTGDTSSASQRNFMIDLNGSKPSHWHYVTESQKPSASGETSSYRGSSVGSSAIGAGDSSASGPPSAGPLINAIITVPAPREHHYHHHHQDHDGLAQESTSADNSSAAQIVDRTIAQLLDGQKNGNIEFSMDLNGEEIVINPLRKHGRSMESASANSTRDLFSNRVKLDVASPDDEALQVPLSNRQLKNLIESDNQRPQSFRRHHISQGSHNSVENQQSASEIDLVDENNDDDESASDGSTDPSIKTSRKVNEDRETDREDKLDDERNSVVSLTGSQTDDIEIGETLSQERAQPVDLEAPTRVNSRKKQKSRAVGVAGRKQTRESQSTGGRSALGSRRRVALKSEDSSSSSDDQLSGDNRRRSSKQMTPTKVSGLSAVMIKGEDLRRLEQLLQSLRSASLSDLPEHKQKRTLSSSQGLRRDYLADDGGNNYKREETETQTTHQAENESWDDHDKGGRQQQVGVPQIAAKTNKDELITLSDCDRRKQQKLPRKVAASDDDNSSYDSDSSQEHTSEANEDGTERDEQGSNNYNSVSPPSSREQQEEPEQPRSLFVRKTILQSYYDDNLKQPNAKRYLGVEPQLYRTEEELPAIRRQRGESGGQQVRKYSSSSDNKLVRGQNSARAESYIDYSKLDDREVHRGNRTYPDHQGESSLANTIL